MVRGLCARLFVLRRADENYYRALLFVLYIIGSQKLLDVLS